MTETGPLLITLPIPSKSLWPNARIHWRKKTPITRHHKEIAHVRTLEALQGVPRAFTGYTLAFFFKDARRRDDDNAAASCKAYRDGIADALKVDDNTLRLAAVPTISIDRKKPRLEITLIP